MTTRASPSERIHAEIDELIAGGRAGEPARALRTMAGKVTLQHPKVTGTTRCSPPACSAPASPAPTPWSRWSSSPASSGACR